MYKVPVILGPVGTPHTLACEKINVQLGVLFQGMSASDLSRKQGNPLYIGDRIPGLYFGDPMAQACIDRGYKKACLLADVSDAYTAWCKRFKEKFEKLGGQVLASEIVDTKTVMDYHSIMTSFKAKNPDIIFIAAWEEPTSIITVHAIEVGYKGKFLFTSEWGSRAEQRVGLQNIEGSLVHASVYTFYRKYPDQDKKGYLTSFLKQYKDTYKEDPAQPGLNIHDSAYLFARAMEVANTVTDVYAIRAACPKAFQEGGMPLVYPNNDVLKNGLVYGTPEFLLEVKGGQYKLTQELMLPREVLE
jgi:ABC-type branched-subunit amino acid transport system substrate-binding protein